MRARARLRGILAGVTAASTVIAGAAAAGDIVQAKVIRIIDGDTFVADIQRGAFRGTWRIRPEGLAAPEIKHRAKCDRERRAGEGATEVARRILAGKTVGLENTRPGRYKGRLLATVRLPNGATFSDTMIAAKAARPWSTGPHDWCK